MEAFDPNAGVVNPDFAQQMTAVQRQRLIAAALRKQAESSAAPQGQMISGRYVAPSIFQHVGNVARQYRAGAAERAADRSETDFAGATNAAAENWRQGLPQAIAAQAQKTAPFVAPGIEGDEVIPGTETITAPATPAQMPTRSSVLARTLEGMRIPGNEKAAELWNRGMSAELEREDTQQFRASESAAARAARAEEKQARLEAEKLRLEAQMQDKALTREQLAEYRKMHDATLRAIAAGRDQAMRDAAAMRAAASGDKPLKAVPQQVLNKLTSLSGDADAMDTLTDSFKPEYGSAQGALMKAVGTWVPGANTEAATWWKDYNRLATLGPRNSLFGATLTPNEMKAWNDANITPGMAPKIIQDNLAKRKALATKKYNEQLDIQNKSSGGNYDVTSAFSKRGTPQAVDPGPVKVKDMAEALKLEPGTPFIDPNGIPRTR